MGSKKKINSLGSILGLLALLSGLLGSLAPAAPVLANTPSPTSVSIAGSLDHVFGCPGDWDPTCAAAHLAYDASDDVWQGSWAVPAGAYEYKATLNEGWTENYGLHAAPGGANIPLNLASGATVKFYYDHKSHWATDNVNSVIATVAGSFQSELGCPGDWDPGCLRSWLQDPDGDGVYSFETTALPKGSYEGKVALNESWDVNYGQNGVQNGPNLAFFVPTDGAKVTFSYVASTHVLTILAGHGHDNNVEWDGLRHDSRDLLYRTPGGAVPAGTPVALRLRTYHNDVTTVVARAYSVNAGAQQLLPMNIEAADVSCYQVGLENQTCDYWEVNLPNGVPDNFWYRFIVTDGTSSAYYADNTPALDGGLGSTSSAPVDNGFALMVYDPAFKSPSWAKDAVIYQIFPDRFRSGSAKNNPKTGDVRYDDPVLSLKWGVLPEGYCRNYADGSTNCPWRYDTNPPASSPTKEQPRGRDYMGGDLKGVDQKLDYLQSLGVNTIYFNPIFDSASNHGYDTQNYYRIDPYFGTQQDWDKLVKDAKEKHIRIVLDGVFNHMSSDSPIFDRYHHYATVGACESATSPYRSWFHFRAPTGSEPAVCAPSTPGGTDTFYDGWFGFDSIPVLNKSNPDVQKYFISGADSVAKHWLDAGAAAWRLDVMGDSSFPSGYWESFRQTVKQKDPSALIIGELWQKDSTLLRFLRGDRADTTMNYRLRDAVLGLLVPGNFDSKGFADSGRPLTPSEFGARLSSIREDYPDAAYFSSMNLLDSHDTERVLWTLTPGAATTADKEQNAANLAAGKQRVKLASLIQFTLPGAPTVYYGDEVGMTGADDPDDRRTYPWADLGGKPDNVMLKHYQTLAAVRKDNPALTRGDFQVLLADDSAETVAFGRKTSSQAALVVINRGSSVQVVNVPVAGYLPDGTIMEGAYAVGNSRSGLIQVSGGMVAVTLNPLSAWILTTEDANLKAPAAPSGLQLTNEGNAQVSLAWSVAKNAAGYNVYRSPVSGGGYVRVNATLITGTVFTDSGLRNAQTFFYTVRSQDAAGNESRPSAEVSALPHYTIGWANTQWPPSIDHTINASNRTPAVYGQVWIDGATNQPGQTPSLRAQLGFGPTGSDPANNPAWRWVDAGFNTNAGNNDEFAASLLPDALGTFDYLYRYSTTNGRDWLYADQSGPLGAGVLPANPGKLNVLSSGDVSAPSAPIGLAVTSASPAGINLVWDAVVGDPSLFGYEVGRSDVAGGPYAVIATVVGAASFSDTSVAEGKTYSYAVRSLDQSFNRSAYSGEVTATAQLRTVTLIFNLTVPATTDATGRSVFIAGFLDRLDGGLPQWNPGGVSLARVDATHWILTLTGKESTQLEYKYALGDWDHVEKDGSCGEISNRILTLSYGGSGTQNVNDVVGNWRNVAPCGN
jgi:glycosidase